MSISVNSAAAKRYFTESLDKGDYYREGQELAGRWFGNGAEKLGLSGPVGQREFFGLSENRVPGSTKNLTERTKANRRVGYDINFHAPKSVTLLYALGGDQRVLPAFQDSVRQTMTDMEASMRGRIRAAGGKGDRITGNMAWAEFVHTTARPVGGIPDPHLHAHCFTFNATFDEVEGKWKAGEFVELKRQATLFEASFHSRLAEKMQELGYGIRAKGKFWEVEGVPDQLIAAFSRRTSEINKLARELGIEHDDARKSQLGARTRQAKDKSLPLDSLREDWKVVAGKDGLAALRSARGKTQPPSPAGMAKAADKELAWAIEHLFERTSAVKEREIIETMLRRGLGQTSPEQVQAAVAAHPFVRRDLLGEKWVSTEAVLLEEKSMLDVVRDGRGRCFSFIRGEHRFKDDKLNESQRAAVSHVLGSRDRVMVIRGGAGTGKTRLMDEAVGAIEKLGFKVSVLAPTGEVARSLSNDRREASTIAKFLVDEEVQKQSKRGVLWIEEAGLVGTRTMAALLDKAAGLGCRVILSGDDRQHKAVERGDALRLIQERAGVQAAEVRTVIRQTGGYKEACELLGKGKTAAGFRKLEALGFIKETKEHEAHATIASEYVAGVRAGKKMLVVSPTHAELERVSGEVRGRLRDEGLIRKKGKELLQLQSKGWTEAEKKLAASYRAGDVIQFHQNARGFKAGSRTEVVGVDRVGNVWVKGKLSPCILNRGQSSRFDVFDTQRIEVSVGDVIRFTRNGKAVGDALGFVPGRSKGGRVLNNGSTYRVRAFVPLSGDLLLDNGWVVRKDYGHIDHGYAVTSHASQGKSVDRVLVACSARSFNAANAEQFYVSVSRAKERCTLFTDNIEELRARVTAGSEKVSATELAERLIAREGLGQRTKENEYGDKGREKER